MKGLYRKIPRDYSVVVESAFSEMDDVTPAAYEMWWVRNHMRYSNRIAGAGAYRKDHLRNLHQLMQLFLSDYVRGKLERAG
jgi:hypothetical protein